MRTTAYIRVLPTERADVHGTGLQGSPESWCVPITLAIRLDARLPRGSGGRLPLSRLIWIANREPGGSGRRLEAVVGLN